MLVAGAGAAVHADGFTAAGLAAHRALAAAGSARVTAVLVFAGGAARRRRIRGRARGGRAHDPGRGGDGCSATGVLTGAKRSRTRARSRCSSLGGDAAAAAAALSPGACATTRARRARGSGREALAALGGDARGAALAVLIDPGGARRGRLRRRASPTRRPSCSSPARARRAARRAAACSMNGARPPGRLRARCVFPAALHPTRRHDPGLPGAQRSADDHGRGRKPDPRDRGPPAGRGLERALSEPRNPGCGQMTRAPARRHRRARLGRAFGLRRAPVRGRRGGSARARRRGAGARGPDDPLHAARRDRRARRHEGDARRAGRGARRRAGALRRLLQLRGARQRALRQAGAGSRADPPSLRRAVRSSESKARSRSRRPAAARAFTCSPACCCSPADRLERLSLGWPHPGLTERRSRPRDA